MIMIQRINSVARTLSQLTARKKPWEQTRSIISGSNLSPSFHATQHPRSRICSRETFADLCEHNLDDATSAPHASRNSRKYEILEEDRVRDNGPAATINLRGIKWSEVVTRSAGQNGTSSGRVLEIKIVSSTMRPTKKQLPISFVTLDVSNDKSRKRNRTKRLRASCEPNRVPITRLKRRMGAWWT